MNTYTKVNLAIYKCSVKVVFLFIIVSLYAYMYVCIMGIVNLLSNPVTVFNSSRNESLNSDSIMDELGNGSSSYGQKMDTDERSPSTKETVNEQRLTYLKNKCSKIGPRSPEVGKVHSIKFMVVENDKAVFIKFAGSESISWRNVLQRLRQNGQKINFTMVYPRSGDSQKLLSRTYFKILFVQHPFSRLLYAYRKFRYEYYETQKKGEKENLSSKIQKFIFKNFRKDKSDAMKSFTFKDFIHQILYGRALKNANLIPMHLQSRPCLVNYDFLGKIETFNQDMDHLKNRFSWRGFPDARRENGTHPEDSSKKYFSQISINDLLKLYKLYETDFRLFKYTIQPYNTYIKNTKLSREPPKSTHGQDLKF